MAKKPEIILEIKTYTDGVLVDQTAKVIEPGPDWFMRIAPGVGIPFGLWAMIMGGAI